MSPYGVGVVPGDWIGNYQVVRRIRAGGMATLFLGERRCMAFTRRAAIKVMHPHLAADERFAQMFFDEAWICSQVDHPNVVAIEDLGEHRGLPYMVMRYIDGVSMNQLLDALASQKRTISSAIAVRIAIAICDGLHWVHELSDGDGLPLGIVHRDVSPANVLLAISGAVKLIDFGIATARGCAGFSESDYPAEGKLRYMAPEQVVCAPVDRRADIYALGVVLWELLAGRELFSDTEVAVLRRVDHPELPAPSVLNPAVSTEIDLVIADMLSADRERRPATALDVRRRLVEALPGAMLVEPAAIGALVRQVTQHWAGEQVRVGRRRPTLDGGVLTTH